MLHLQPVVRKRKMIKQNDVKTPLAKASPLLAAAALPFLCSRFAFTLRLNGAQPSRRHEHRATEFWGADGQSTGHHQAGKQDPGCSEATSLNPCRAHGSRKHEGGLRPDTKDGQLERVLGASALYELANVGYPANALALSFFLPGL